MGFGYSNDSFNVYCDGRNVALAFASHSKWMENRMINTLVQLLMATIILIIQKHFFVDGFKGLLRKAPNMDSLVALGSSASYLYALAMTFIMAYAMGRGNMELVHMSSHSLYYDSAAMIVTLVSVGKYLESRSKSKTGML